MACFSDASLRAAARWIASQRRELREEDNLAPRAMREEIYCRQALTELEGLAPYCGDGRERQLGLSVVRGQDADGELLVATVLVRDCGVFGYLPPATRPTFIWPADLAELMRARWAAEDAGER